MVEEPGGDRVLSEKRVWHHYDGGAHDHYNLPITSGTKVSVIAFQERA